jgi:tetrahydromethanopterin S-methyltransferase subunit B
VARRLIERERALDEDSELMNRVGGREAVRARGRQRRRGLGALAIGFVLGILTLAVAAFVLASRM